MAIKFNQVRHFKLRAAREILERLGKTYLPESGVARLAASGLQKMNYDELSALLAMVTTTVKKD